MKRVAIGCAVMLVIFLAVAMISLGVSRSRSGVRANSWVRADLSGEFAEFRPPSILTALNLDESPLLRDVTDALDRAADDDRISGVLVRIDRLEAGWGKTAELRSHLAGYAGSGKPLVCFMETAGEFAPANKEYYLASACPKIVLAPAGDVNLLGLMSSSTFYRGTFDLLGIYPDIEHIGDYKAMKNIYTEKSYTDAHREMTTSILQSVEGTLVAGVAEGRKMTPDAVRALFPRAPFSASEAKEAGLVDSLEYWDQVVAGITPEGEDRPRTVSVTQYLATGRPDSTGSREIAVIYAVGEILRGRSQQDVLSGLTIIGSESLSEWIHAAADNKAVSAIVLRVDSPGGSAMGSDLIWREVERAKEKKPVVVSMSDLAGSGGYYISVPATEIVAQPTTLTASIGVVAGKMEIKGLLNKIGLTEDRILLEPAAGYYDPYERYTPEQKAMQWKSLQRIYADFTERVAKGRNMSVADVDNVGQGRVWTGAQAKEIGLVDHLGGLDTALARAKDLAHLDAEAPVRLHVYPEQKSLWQILHDEDQGVLSPATLKTLSRLQAGIRAVSRVAAAAEEPESRVLSMDAVPDIR